MQWSLHVNFSFIKTNTITYTLQMFYCSLFHQTHTPYMKRFVSIQNLHIRLTTNVQKMMKKNTYIFFMNVLSLFQQIFNKINISNSCCLTKCGHDVHNFCVIKLSVSQVRDWQFLSRHIYHFSHKFLFAINKSKSWHFSKRLFRIQLTMNSSRLCNSWKFFGG